VNDFVMAIQALLNLEGPLRCLAVMVDFTATDAE
jgi:hypothetical protein